MDFNFTEINTAHLPLYFIIGIVLFVFFYTSNNYIIPFLSTRKLVIKNWKKIEITIWVLYGGVLFIAFFKASALITLIATVILISLGLNFWQNIFSGIIIKFTNQFEIGEVISTSFVKGELKKINLSQLELINDKGEIIMIPNRMIRNAVLTHYHKKNNVQMHAFKVGFTENKTLESIHTLALNCPYISANQKIHIEQVNNEFIINASIIDPSLIGKVNAYFQTLK